MAIFDEIEEVLQTTYDPELGLDLRTLGFVKDIQFDEARQDLQIKLVLTSIFCPYAVELKRELQSKFEDLGVKTVVIEQLDEPWEPTPEVREMLGL